MNQAARRALVVIALTLGPAALGQAADGGLDSFDASLPDASVGMGGADQTSEENDIGAPCVSSRECQGATACVDGRCVPRPVQDLGCTASPAVVVATLPAVVVLRRRRQRAERGITRADGARRRGQ